MDKIYSVSFLTHESNTPFSNVPCGECVHCCIHLSPFLTSEEFESGKYIYTFIKTEFSKMPVIAIPRTERGCIYLVNNKCSIYEARPKACRQFDCRKGHYPPFKKIALDKFGEYREEE